MTGQDPAVAFERAPGQENAIMLAPAQVKPARPRAPGGSAENQHRTFRTATTGQRVCHGLAFRKRVTCGPDPCCSAGRVIGRRGNRDGIEKRARTGIRRAADLLESAVKAAGWDGQDRGCRDLRMAPQKPNLAIFFGDYTAALRGPQRPPLAWAGQIQSV